MVVVFQVLVALAVLMATCLVCWHYWTHRHIMAVARKLPAFMPTLPLLGHGYLALKGVNGAIDALFQSVEKVVAKSTRTMVLWIGLSPIFLLFGPDDIEVVLNSSRAPDRGPEFEFGKFALGQGLITAPGYIWKITKRYVNPIFNPRNLELMLPMFNECSRDLTTSLSKHVGEEQVEVMDYVFTAALKSTCMLVYGQDINIDFRSDLFQRLEEAIARYTHDSFTLLAMNISATYKITAARFLKIWLWPEFIFLFLYKKKMNFIETTLRNFSKEPLKFIEEMKKTREYESKPTESVCKEEFNGKESPKQVTLPDAYSALQQSYPTFTDQDLLNEVITLLVGGSETTKVVVSSCLLALAANPEIQEKLYSEIITVVDCHNTEVTLENIKSLPYLDQVVKETLRRFLILLHISRKAQENIVLKDFTIPAGATIAVVPYGVHMDPKLYPDPKRFDPERFTPENVARRGRCTFLPFGTGPRSCIGKTYALINVKIMVIHVLARYKLSTDVNLDHISYTGGLSVCRLEGYPIRLQTRV